MFSKGGKRIITQRSSTGRVVYSKTIVKDRFAEDIEKDKTEYQTENHMIPLQDLVFKLGTNLDRGLSLEEADERLRINGPNCLAPHAAISKWTVFINNFIGGFSGLLWFGAIFSFVGYSIAIYANPKSATDQLYMGIALTVVVMITGTFGFIQEASNIKVIEGFSKIAPTTANVIRDGKVISIPTEEVVVGDIVRIQLGDSVPADIRIIEAQGLSIEASALTGESKPVRKSTAFTDENPLETANLAFFGTFVVEGSGKGIVIGCGDDTAMGRIASLTTGIEKQETHMTRDLKRFVRIITVIAFVIGILFFSAALLIGYDIFTAFLFFIAIVVANIPESLLVTLTACLTLTAKRMSANNCAIKKLQAIETLGSTTVICSDKTGTLTQNRMSVNHLYYEDKIFDLSEHFEEVDNLSSGFAALCRTAILCMRAEFKADQDHLPISQRAVIGDASETAVLRCMEQIVGNVKQKQVQNPKVFEIPFNSSNKYQLSVHKYQQNHVLLLVVKGAPEKVISFCSTIYNGSKDVQLTDEGRKTLNKVVLKLSSMGERVLAFADRLLPTDKYPVKYKFNESNVPLADLRFVGLMSMIDPPRSTVPMAVRKCKSAGIRVVMVTGDHPVTAAAIAKKVGIISEETEVVYRRASFRLSPTSDLIKTNQKERAIVITGNDLRHMEDEELYNLINEFSEMVFARTSPQQKLRIVEAFQHWGETVAVTGDGVNDSPALKKADIGIAMGIAGTDVAKEAADMILMDDNFASIVTGIEEGRLIFDNLKKSIAYLLTSNVPEGAPFILFVCLGVPQSLSVIAILAIDIGTDLWPSISLAYEKPEADIMSRKPRNPQKDKLVTMKLILYSYLQIGIIQTCASLASFFIMMAMHGWFIQRLIQIREQWEDEFINDLKDSFGVEWTYLERRTLERKGYAASFLTIVITQISDLLICKTRRLSLFQQGMTNWAMNLAILVEIALAITFVYCPGVQQVLQFEYVEWFIMLPAVPYAILIFIYDEFRKAMIRRKPGGWAEQELYY